MWVYDIEGAIDKVAIRIMGGRIRGKRSKGSENG
jgi:hypothetical protein